jgi:hypothetical protein
MGEAAHPDDGRFIGKPCGAPELFTEVDGLMRNPSSVLRGRVSSTRAFSLS